MVYDLVRGTRENMLTGGDTLSHAISPDGLLLACTVNRDDGYGIDLLSLTDGRRVKRIVQPGDDYQSDLQWSADGKYIVFRMSPHEGAPRDLWTIELTDGATPKRIVHSSGSEAKPAISPDVKWLAYASDVSGQSQIYLTSFPDGQTMRQVSNGGGSSPSWAPDGKQIYFIAPQGLVAVEISPSGAVTGKPKVVYDKPFGQSDPLGRDYTIAPDGRPLIIEPSERRPTVSHLQVITNWWKLLP
jgi:Tol biopolymer transport system component